MPAGQEFVYGVKTTGVYCRPAAEHVSHAQHSSFDTQQAGKSGYRPNKRNSADQTQAAAPCAPGRCGGGDRAGRRCPLRTWTTAPAEPVPFHRVFRPARVDAKGLRRDHRSRRDRAHLQDNLAVNDAL